jgi:pilus assembly protein CpaF
MKEQTRFGRRVSGSFAPQKVEAGAQLGGAPVTSEVAGLEESREMVRSALLMRIDPSVTARMSPAGLRAEIDRLVAEIATEERVQLNAREQRQLITELVDDMLGLGPLEPLLADDTVNDILVNGPHQVYVERRGKLELTTARFRDADHASGVAQRIAAAVGRRVNETSPLCDARLADGSRVNIVLSPLALKGPIISIRKFSKRSISLDIMARNGNMSEPLARLLEICARTRLNIVISGGTGSGKTTLLNAMSSLIDPTERIVTIEDAAELQLQQPHVVPMETRPPNLEGTGEINQRDLLKNALRMRPDRIILGEVRGTEAFDMLQAMNTGHDGSMSTVHANTPRDALSRLENMVLQGNMGLPAKAIRQQISSAIDVIVQVERMRDGIRRIQHVVEVAGMEGDVIITQDLFTYKYEGENRDSTLKGSFVSSRFRPLFYQKVAFFGLEERLNEAMGIGAAHGN